MFWVAGIVAGVIFLVAIIAAVAAFIASRSDKGESNRRGRRVFRPENEVAGEQGESVVNYHLRSLLGSDEYLLTNLLLPLPNGYKTEVDAILISHKGVFCVETKNWNGHIYGGDEDEFWEQKYDDPNRPNRKNKNPVKQNEGHCAALNRILNGEFPIYNTVIFMRLKYWGGIDSESAFTLSEFMQYYATLPDGEIDAEDLKFIHHRLMGFQASLEELERHKEECQKHFNN